MLDSLFMRFKNFLPSSKFLKSAYSIPYSLHLRSVAWILFFSAISFLFFSQCLIVGNIEY